MQNLPEKLTTEKYFIDIILHKQIVTKSKSVNLYNSYMVQLFNTVACSTDRTNTHLVLRVQPSIYLLTILLEG